MEKEEGERFRKREGKGSREMKRWGGGVGRRRGGVWREKGGGVRG